MPRRGPHHDNITWDPHIRVAWGGILGSGPEVWTNSIKWLSDANTVLSPADALHACDDVKGYIQQWFTANGSDAHPNISYDAHCTWVKVNSINGDGLQYGDTNVLEFAPISGNSGAGTTVPYYTTFALSLMTALKRGRAHIGRIYPPIVEVPVLPGTGMCDPLQAAAMAKAFSNFLVSTKTIMTPYLGAGHWAVLSPGDSLKGTVPKNAAIIGVTCDTVPDTQHRRVNRLKGVRSGLQPVA